MRTTHHLFYSYTRAHFAIRQAERRTTHNPPTVNPYQSLSLYPCATRRTREREASKPRNKKLLKVLGGSGVATNASLEMINGFCLRHCARRAPQQEAEPLSLGVRTHTHAENG